MTIPHTKNRLTELYAELADLERRDLANHLTDNAYAISGRLERMRWAMEAVKQEIRDIEREKADD